MLVNTDSDTKDSVIPERAGDKVESDVLAVTGKNNGVVFTSRELLLGCDEERV